MTTTMEEPLTTDINPVNNLGRQERQILMKLMGPQSRLDYPTEPLEMANGCIVEKYIIPDKDRSDVLRMLYPFTEPPALDAVLIDIHTESPFAVRDYLATREGGLNFLAAPRYAEAGGTVLDWVENTGFPVTARFVRSPVEAASQQDCTTDRE